MKSTTISTCKIRVQTKDGPVDIPAGGEVPVDLIDPQKVANLRDRGCLVCESDLVQEDDHPTGKVNLLSIPVEDISLQTNTVSALRGAGLKTVGDIAAYGNENGSLTSVDGIGESTEKAIQAAIGKLQESR